MALRDLSRTETDSNLIDRRHAQLAVLPRRREGVRGQYRGARRPLAAPPAGALHPQSRARRPTICRLEYSISPSPPAVIADDNFAWDVWEAAGRYPPNASRATCATARISGEEVWIDTRRLRLRRRLPNTKQKLRPYGLKPRKKEKVPGRMGQPVERRRNLLLSPGRPDHRGLRPLPQKEGQEHSLRGAVRVEPFTTSILDGIDLRETIRKWYEKRIYVRHFQKIHGEVGSVVVIFDEDRDNRYSYMTTWLGENQNESDMAFYSTFPFDNLVGPASAAANMAAF